MHNQPKKYIFVHLIDKKPVGSSLGLQIPLHMTILHWFSTESPASGIIEATSLAIKNIGQINTIATDDDLFGPERDIPVIRVNRTPELLQLHQNLVQSMKELGAEFDERWVGEANWNPHVTHKPNRRLHAGDKLLINNIDLISKDKNNGVRRIVHRFKLNKY